GHFRLDAETQLEVVGVVEDGKYIALTEDPRGAYFLPIAQMQNPNTYTWLIVRSNREPQQVAGTLHEVLHGLDEALPFTLMTWDEEQNSALFAARAATLSLGVLGALGAMLAITGIFGMASYSVGKRLKEMGIRIALGASHMQVLKAALGRAFRVLAAGSIAGLA